MPEVQRVVEVMTSVQCRRRSVAAKIRLVEETLEPAKPVSFVARKQHVAKPAVQLGAPGGRGWPGSGPAPPGCAARGRAPIRGAQDAAAGGVAHALLQPGHSAECNGIAEAFANTFKGDCVRLHARPDVAP
jgi:hypothetical protein